MVFVKVMAGRTRYKGNFSTNSTLEVELAGKRLILSKEDTEGGILNSGVARGRGIGKYLLC